MKGRRLDCNKMLKRPRRELKSSSAFPIQVTEKKYNEPLFDIQCRTDVPESTDKIYLITAVSTHSQQLKDYKYCCLC